MDLLMKWVHVYFRMNLMSNRFFSNLKKRRVRMSTGSAQVPISSLTFSLSFSLSLSLLLKFISYSSSSPSSSSSSSVSSGGGACF